MGRALPIDMDTVIAGAILADVGKLLEYEMGADGKSRQSERGEALRHPFTGVALALECGVPDAVCHIIAAHAAEGDLVKRTTEAYIVHHADFMAFLPFKNPEEHQSSNSEIGDVRVGHANAADAKETITAKMSRWAAGLSYPAALAGSRVPGQALPAGFRRLRAGRISAARREDRARGARRNRRARSGDRDRHGQAHGSRSRLRWPMR